MEDSMIQMADLIFDTRWKVSIIQDGRFYYTGWKVLLYKMKGSIIQDERFYYT